MRVNKSTIAWYDATWHPDKHPEQPLTWRKPRRVRVQSDLWQASVSYEWIDRMCAVMARATQHTFVVCTTHAERMYAYFCGRMHSSRWRDHAVHRISDLLGQTQTEPIERAQSFVAFSSQIVWPLSNVWLGVSVENQATADTRLPWLLKTPAALRFLSLEPLLDGVDLRLDSMGIPCNTWGQPLGDCGYYCDEIVGHIDHGTLLDWVLCGGESGPKARPCNLAWLRSVVQQCAAAHVPCCVTQLGSQSVGGCGSLLNPGSPALWDSRFSWHDRKGADPAEWPSDLRVQQCPEASR